jgi:hypothetical protein
MASVIEIALRTGVRYSKKRNNALPVSQPTLNDWWIDFDPKRLKLIKVN